MLKINFEAKPFYSICGLNEPCMKHLEIEFAEDAGLEEVLAEFIKALYFAGYGKISKKWMDNFSEMLINEGIIENDEENVESE